MAHHLIIGATGTGKSTLLADLALAVEGGLIVLDPNETFAVRVADNFPSRDGSTNDCIYFDPTDTPIPLNVLYDVPEGRPRHRVASNMVATLKARWDDSWGPRLEWILYNSIRLAIDNNLTLLHVPQILTNKPFRKQQLRNSSYPTFWLNEFEKWSDKQQQEYTASVLNKVGQFAADPVIRDLMGQRACFNFQKALSKRVVINLSKGKLGEIPSSLLGSILVSTIFQTAQSLETPIPCTLIIDEFSNFITEHFNTILSEARKYGMSLVIATQHLEQIPKELRASVLGNVARITCFRVSPEDAEVLMHHLDITDPTALSDLPNFRYRYNETHPPHAKLLTTEPPPPSLGTFDAVKQHTLDNYVRSSQKISDDLARL